MSELKKKVINNKWWKKNLKKKTWGTKKTLNEKAKQIIAQMLQINWFNLRPNS
jgi:hypothetical protein